MLVRLGARVRLREDDFGGICYVPHRDDFFACTEDVYAMLRLLSRDWTEAPTSAQEAVSALAGLGICETRDPNLAEISYSGPSFLGPFMEIPTVAEPLVLNCFATAHCPLRCTYCHADDLMAQFRVGEAPDDEADGDPALANVVATASSIPAMVAVITGGDPLTRPKRTAFLVERLAETKALVLDTSGVGAFEELLPVLLKHQVHLRVSLDAMSEVNRRVRPVNPAYVGRGGAASGPIAQSTIERALSAGLDVTVQTVISSRNESVAEWSELRDWLLDRGVRNWVLHIAIRGGKARRIQEAALKTQKRPRGILPSDDVRLKLSGFIRDTQSRGSPIDIRCTDTDSTPNSVLLVDSKGDLYTEGYAHNGKVTLYDSSSGRADQIRKKWHHIDRFGHARRYLNWNPWLADGKSLESTCYHVPVPSSLAGMETSLLEREAKHAVPLPSLVDGLLTGAGWSKSSPTLQRDEYYDNEAAALASLDFVVRLRAQSGRWIASLKGPRFYTPLGEYTRIELEIEASSELEVKTELARRKLACSWFFEKRRTLYRHPAEDGLVCLDEIPRFGFFVEIEGTGPFIDTVRALLGDSIGPSESLNYRAIYLREAKRQGAGTPDIRGAEFE